MTLLDDVLVKYKAHINAPQLVSPLVTKLRYRTGVESVTFSGSYAKGTAVRVGSSGSDIDLFISFSPSSYTLRGAYEDIYEFASSNNLAPRRQNVSIGINFNGIKVDLVPARRQEGYTNWHSLYVSKASTWTQTNVAQHIQTVSNSNRISEIKLGKIWKRLHNIDIPAFYLELIFIQALKYKQQGNLSANFQAALDYLASEITTLKIVDPSNSNNIISDTLTPTQKFSVASAAKHAAKATYWSDVIW